MKTVQPSQYDTAQLVNKRVYVAATMILFKDPMYRKCLQFVQACYPASILSARDTYTSTQDWLNHFESDIRSIDVCVAIMDDSRTIGRGVYTEYETFVSLGKPVFFYPGSEQRMYRASQVCRIENPTPFEWAYVSLTLPLELETLATDVAASSMQTLPTFELEPHQPDTIQPDTQS